MIESRGRWMVRAALAAALVLCGNVARAQALKVGVQLPLTGERADVAKLMQNGLQMALDRVNAAAGAAGPRFELEWVDDQDSSEGAVAAAGKLAADPQVIAIVGEINSPLVLASKPIVEQQGVPYLTGGSSPRTTDRSAWIFRAGASDTLLTTFLTRYIVEDLKAREIALLHDKTGVHNNRAGLVASALQEKYGITPQVNAAWSPGDRDFGALLAQAKNAQVILALGETPEGGPFLRQAHEAGVRGQIVAHRDFGAPSALAEAGAGADGALIFTEYAPDLQGKATQDWAAAYRQRFGSGPNVIAAQYYDSLLLLAEAVKSGGATRAGVKKGLEGVKAFPGVLADYTFDAGHNGVHRFFVARVQGGKLTPVTVLSEPVN